MATQTFEQFRNQVSSDKALQAEVAACFSSPPSAESDGFDKLVAFGKSHGFDVTAEHARQATTAGTASLSDFELELVSGGMSKEEKRLHELAVQANVDRDRQHAKDNGSRYRS